MTPKYLAFIILMPFLGALFNVLFGPRVSNRTVSIVGCGTVIAAFLLSLLPCAELFQLWLRAPEHASIPLNCWTWISSGELSLSMAFVLDPLSAVMLLVVTGVGSLIHIFSVGYMQGDKAYWRYFAYLNSFMFSMLFLILGKNLLVLFIGWQGVALCSYLLVGFWYDDMSKSRAGQKAFITNRVSDFSFLVGVFILLYYSQGDLDFLRLSDLVAPGGALSNPANTGTITLICLLFFVGAAGKSAQVPLHVWMPDAMAAPLPASALIHSATMATAGVYLMARMNFLFAASPTAMSVIAIVGGATALFAASVALVQTDIRKVLAYSTVSQLGFMVLAIGVGGFVAAIFHLVTHAFFKACLILGSGSVLHALEDEEDIRKMGGMRKQLPVTARTFFISGLAMAGVVPFAGFFSTGQILSVAATSQHSGHPPMLLACVLGILAALCTALYIFRLYYLVFEGEFRGEHHALEHAREERVMNTPLIVLAALATICGLLGAPAALHVPHLLTDWLHPVFAEGMARFTYQHAHTLEWPMMGVVLTTAVVGWLIARRIYRRPAAELPIAPTTSGWHRVLYNQWYVDAFYAMAVVRPLRGLAEWLHRRIDVALIDTLLVLGPARLTARLGVALRRTQNGDLHTYIAAILVGCALLLVFVN